MLRKNFYKDLFPQEELLNKATIIGKILLVIIMTQKEKQNKEHKKPELVAEDVPVKTKHIDEECDLYMGEYQNGQTALIFRDSMGAPAIKPTVALSNKSLDPNEVAIKNYSENEGILESLQNQDIVSDVKDTVEQGYVEIPICELTLDQ